MTEEPSVVFLIPFASRQVRANWPTACKYLQQTIRSIRNSVSQNYRVIVAGSEEPELERGFDGKIHFLSVNNQFPSHLGVRAAQRSDKLAKIGAAWSHAKSKWQPKYVMKLDADDFISSRLVGWLDANGTEAGYLVRYGWLRDHHVAAQRHSSKVCRPIFAPRIRAAHAFFRCPHLSSHSESMPGVTGDRTHKFSLRMCLGALRRTRFITQKFRKEFMLG